MFPMQFYKQWAGRRILRNYHIEIKQLGVIPVFHSAGMICLIIQDFFISSKVLVLKFSLNTIAECFCNLEIPLISDG